ncbi:MAG: flagellar motor switch protein FliN [Deltaproteobacteria bacterium]|nr:flagellar motor switch protein FliN [Deltaproteobacteria bacterium]
MKDVQDDSGAGAPVAASSGAGALHGQGADTPNLEMLLDIPVTVSVEIGRARMTVREFLGLAKESVVELDKPVGEPMDVFVNGKLVARGEAVVVNERFGIRLTEVVSAPERAQRLR